MIKRVCIVAKKKHNKLAGLAKKYGMTLDTKNPQAVLTWGGDGTLLFSERLFPGIPKVPFRDSKICNKCHNHPVEHILDRLAKGKYCRQEYTTLKVRSLQALNDVIIRNKEQQQALRFSLNVDGRDYGEFMGDGIVVATPFGSTGYYYSITKKSFNKNFRIALNNPTTVAKSFVMKHKCTIQSLRHSALVTADNNPKSFTLKQGRQVTIIPGKKTSLLLV